MNRMIETRWKVFCAAACDGMTPEAIESARRMFFAGAFAAVQVLTRSRFNSQQIDDVAAELDQFIYANMQREGVPHD